MATDQQIVNPSFNFTWDSSQNPKTGKVFAKKRKQPPTSGKIKQQENNSIPQKKPFKVDGNQRKPEKQNDFKNKKQKFNKHQKDSDDGNKEKQNDFKSKKFNKFQKNNNNFLDEGNNKKPENEQKQNDFNNKKQNFNKHQKDNNNFLDEGNKEKQSDFNSKKQNFNKHRKDNDEGNKEKQNDFKSKKFNKFQKDNNSAIDEGNNRFKNKTVDSDAPNKTLDFQSSEGNIKRKYKKDKLLSKQLARDGIQADVVSGQNNQKNYSLFNVKPKELYADTSAGKSRSEKVFDGGSFKDLTVHKHLVSNLEKIGFPKLTNVQKKAIPVVMSGENTLIRSQTGSGKTLAYAVPIIDALQGLSPRLKRGDGVQAIIVVPTRELALQTHELFSKINTFQWVVVGHLCGGENRKSEKDRIRKGLNVLIGTPGRLLDHVLHTAALKVDKVRCLVLDEADRLLDMGFRKDIISLVEELDKAKSNSGYDPMAMIKQNQNTDDDVDVDEQIDESAAPLKNPNSKQRQTILLSATLNSGVSELAEFTMKDHTYVDALDQTADETTPQGFIIPSTVRQEFVLTYVKHRLFTLSALLIAKSKNDSKIFVFMASTQMVEYHYDLFTKYLINMPVNRGKTKIGNVALVGRYSDSEEDDDEEELALDIEFFKLHGNMDQKSRKEVFNSFRAASRGVLICTDVAARGLDVPEADCIIQYTGPQTDEDYLHRVGRTGRAGKSGSAIIFLTHEEQEFINHLRDLKVFLKQRNTDEYLKHLCELMEEPEPETAATALQRRFESALAKDEELHRSACFAYSTWSRFYNSYPGKMREFFNFKAVNLGHYVTSFGLKETPTTVSKVVRGQVANVEVPRLNKKLANHKIDTVPNVTMKIKKNKRSNHLMMSEFASGLEPAKKKKKKKPEDDEDV